MMRDERFARRSGWSRSRWWTPSISVLLGALMFTAFATGGHTGDGVRALAVMTAVAAIFVLGSRSDTLSGLGGPGRDERWARIDTTANAVTGVVIVSAVVVLWLVEVAGGQDGSPYVQLGALAGVTYILAIAWLRRRS